MQCIKCPRRGFCIPDECEVLAMQKIDRLMDRFTVCMLISGVLMIASHITYAYCMGRLP